jgi:hypothetical protein
VTDLLVARSGSWVKYGLTSIPISNRDSLVVGVDKPGPSNTGVLPGITRTTVTAASQLPGGGLQPGTTYSNYTFEFIVTPPTGTSTIRFNNCLFRGIPNASGYTSTTSLAKVWDPGRCPTEYWDCTFAAQAPSAWICGLNGHHFKAYRCDISQVVDGFEVFNTNAPDAATGVVVQQCWVHDLLWFAPGVPGTGTDGSHNDCGQVEGGSGGTILGNTLECFNGVNYFNSFYGISQGNAALQIKPDVGLLTGWVVEQNWFSGGRLATVNFAHDAPARFIGNFGTLKRNVFTRDSAALTSGDQREIIAPTTSPPTIDYGSGTTVATTNVYHDTMTGPVTVSNGG